MRTKQGKHLQKQDFGKKDAFSALQQTTNCSKEDMNKLSNLITSIM
jgi:hypothetical protein